MSKHRFAFAQYHHYSINSTAQTNGNQHLRRVCPLRDHLDLLGYFLLFNAGTAGAIEAVRFVKAHGLIFHFSLGSVIFLFEDYIRLDGLEFGLEVADGMAMGAAVGATTSVGEGVAIIVLFFARTAPTDWSVILSP